MSIISKIITAAYPLQMKISKLTGMGIRILENKENAIAPESFYTLNAIRTMAKRFLLKNIGIRKF